MPRAKVQVMKWDPEEQGILLDMGSGQALAFACKQFYWDKISQTIYFIYLDGNSIDFRIFADMGNRPQPS